MKTGNRKLALTVVACLFATGCGGTKPIDEKRLRPKTESTKILAADGSTITTLKQEENREAVPLKRIPKQVRNAVIAIEDVRFYTHRGIDLKAIVRALVADAKSGRIVQGGSTITQQLVRSALSEVGRESTIRRKLKEAIFAYRVDSGYSKSKILELYLNTVYFGEGAYGVQTAARHFFDKDVEDLSLAEAALLAGMIRSPVAYSPRTNGAAAVQRRNLVLERMRLARLAKPADVRKARLAPLVILEQKQERYPAAFFVDYVTRLIQRSDEFAALGSSEQERGDLLFRRGLRVHTTLDPKMQRGAETAIAKVLDQPGDPSASLVAIDPKNGFVRALVGGKDYFAGADADPCALLGAINADGSPKLCAKVNLALGQGGGGSGRQGGSSFKPFVLASALENDIRMNDTFSAPSCIDIPEADAGGTKPWHVCNYEDQGFGGAVTVGEGTYRSINTVYAQMITAIGAKKVGSKLRGKGSGLARAEAGGRAVADTARRMGICRGIAPLLSKGASCDLSAVASAALGANAVNALDMASAFATFPNLGVYRRPIAIRKITDAQGKVLWQAKQETEQALTAPVAYAALTALQDVIRKGTGSRNGQIGRPAFGKTGTAQEWRDAWFVGGAGTDLVAAVSVFWPDGEIEMKPACRGRGTYTIKAGTAGEPVAIPPKCRSTRIRVAGGTWPTQIWREFMTAALKGTPASKLPTLEGPEVRKLLGGGTYRCLGAGSLPSSPQPDPLTGLLLQPQTDTNGCYAPVPSPSASLDPEILEQAEKVREALEDAVREETRQERRLRRRLEREAEELREEQEKQAEELRKNQGGNI